MNNLKLFLDGTVCTKEEFAKKYEIIKNKEGFFGAVLIELKNCILESNITRIKHIGTIFEYIKDSESKDILKNYYQNGINPIKDTNLVILACRHNKVEVLDFLLENNSILENVCTLSEKKSILPEDHDEMQHNAFYYALRSGNIQLIETLVEKWPSNYFKIHSEQLDEILSSAYEELKLKNVPIASVIEVYVQKTLLNLRFFPGKSTKTLNDTDALDAIKERLKLICDIIESLSDEYISSSVTIDDKFLYIISFIAKNIHMLKKQLKVTYDELPWEEMELCLIIFVSSYLKKQEINLFARTILQKTNILNYLEAFRDNLYKINFSKYKNVAKLIKMPRMKKEDAMKQIIRRESRFKELYSDFSALRDIYSLEHIHTYTSVALEADVKSKEGKLILTRALQVIGEHVNNTLESPKLSKATSDRLSLSLPINTRNMLNDLRNSLSHDKSLPKRSDTDENLGYDIYINVQNDLKIFHNVMTCIFFNKKNQMVKLLLKRIIEADHFNQMKEASDVLDNIKLENLNFYCTDMVTHQQLQKLVKELNDSLKDKTPEEIFYLEKIENLVRMESTKLIDFGTRYMMGIACLTDLNHGMNYYKIEKDVLRGIKFQAREILENISLEIEPSSFEKMTRYLRIIYKSRRMKYPAEADKIASLTCQISDHFGNDLSIMESIGELERRIKVPAVKKKCKDTEKEINESKTIVKGKIYELKAVISNYELHSNSTERISFYVRDKSLQLVLEILVLDILSVLDSKLENNNTFLDDKIPILCGKTLRNDLAHNNVISTLLSSEISILTLLNAEKLVSENLMDCEIRIGQINKYNISEVRSKFEQNLHTIFLQKSMFTAIEKQNLDDLKLALRNGADTFGENIQSCNALHYASKGNSLEIVQFFLKEKLNVNKRNENGQSPLHFAAAYGKKQILEFLIRDLKMDINTVDLSGKTPMHLAVIHGHIDTIQTLMQNKCDINIRDFTGITPAHYASRNANLDAAKCILENFKNIDTDRSVGGLSFLYEAAERGSTDLVKFLLQKGSNVNSKIDQESTPLHMASLNGHLETVNILISKGANTNSRTIDNCTPLHYAVENGHLKVVEVLLKHGTDVNSFDITSHYTPLHYAAEDGFEGIVNILLKYKANVMTKTIGGETPLHLAASKGHLEIATALLEYGTDINTRDTYGNTPMHQAAQGGNKKLVQLLITKKGLVSAKNSKHGFSPLHISVSYSNKDVTEVLINNNADVNSKAHTGTTPLHLAASVNDKIVIDMLIEHKSKINVADNNCYTPLHVAAENGHEYAVSVLVNRGANVNCETSIGLTPLKLALLHNHKEIVSILLNNGADVNLPGKGCHFTPLQVAMISGDKTIVEMLIEKGADINANENGETALMYAVRFNNKIIVEVLLDNGADIFNPKCSAVILAVFEGYYKIVKLFLKHKNCLNKSMSPNTKASIVKGKKYFTNDFVKKQLIDLNDFGEDCLIERYNTVNNCFLDENFSLLQVSVMRGHKEITKLLIEDGELVNSLSPYSITPLYIAAYKGYVDIVNILIEHKADLNAPDFEKSTPLHMAAALGHNNVVKVLIKHGANINATDFKHRTPLEFAVCRGHLKVVKTFFELRKDVNKSCYFENGTLLHIAAQEKNLEIMKFLVNVGCDIQAKNRHGSKPIHIASRDSVPEAVEFFLCKGSSINDFGINNQTPLHYAVVNADLSVLKYLIDLGADVNAKDNGGATPLHIAAFCSTKETVLCLLSNGAIYNPIYRTQDKDVDNLFQGIDWLIEGVKCNDPLKVEKSFAQGAIGNIGRANFGTPLHYAAWKGYYEIVNILLRNNCNPNIYGRKGCTPLHYASEYSHINIVKALLSKGAIYNAPTDSGKTPLDFATDERIVKLFKDIHNSFEDVRNRHVYVVENIKGMKDTDTVKSILNACHKENKSLVVFAILNKFPYVQDLKDILPEGVNSKIQVGVSFLQAGDYKNALRIFLPVYKKKQEMLGMTNPATLDIHGYIAKAWYKLGKYTLALNILEDIYAKQRDNFGDYHIETLSTRSSIALHLHRLDKDEQAFDIFQEVFPVQKDKLGSNHEDTLQTQLHMALVLNKLGMFKEALVHNQEVYDIRRKSNHPAAVYALNNIAMVLANLKKPDEAIKIFRDVLVKKKLLLGTNHPDVFKTMDKIARLLFEQRKHSEALYAYKELLERQNETLGQNHIDTLDTQGRMADIFFALGQYNDAHKLYTEGFNQRQVVLGHDHPTVKAIAVKKEIIVLNLKFKGHTDDVISRYLQK